MYYQGTKLTAKVFQKALIELRVKFVKDCKPYDSDEFCMLRVLLDCIGDNQIDKIIIPNKY